METRGCWDARQQAKQQGTGLPRSTVTGARRRRGRQRCRREWVPELWVTPLLLTFLQCPQLIQSSFTKCLLKLGVQWGKVRPCPHRHAQERRHRAAGRRRVKCMDCGGGRETQVGLGGHERPCRGRQG